jgi:hypothetical protein
MIGKSYFNRIGAAFANKDGEGHNMEFDSLPVDGRVTIRTPRERLKEGKTAGKDKDRGQER